MPSLGSAPSLAPSASPLPSMPSLGSAPSPSPSASPLSSMPSLGSAPSSAPSASLLPSMPSLGSAPSSASSVSPLPSMPSLGSAPSPSPSASPLPSMPSLGSTPSPSPSASPLPSMPSLGSVPKPMVNSASGIAGHPRPSAPVGMPRPHLTNTPSASVGISRPKTANPPTAPSLPAGSPTFSKPRSAAIYAKLCSPSVDEQRSGMKDVAFVMGQDQMILIEKAISLEDESIRIAAVKILSRRRTPDVKEILSRLTGDSNDTIASMAKKSLMLMK